MSNPYHPPESPSNATESIDSLGPVRYAGGWWGIIAIGAIAGASVMLIYFPFGEPIKNLPNPLFTVAVFWLAALALSVSLLRGVSATPKVKAIISLCALPVCYALYVPVCSFGAMALNGGNYNVNDHQPVIASIISFAIILLLTCSVIRNIMIRRQERKTRESLTSENSDLDDLNESEVPGT